MAKRTPAGQFRHVIDIVAPTTAVDTYGHRNSTGGVVEETQRAKIETLSGDEAIVARQLYPLAKYRVTTDYTSVLDTSDAKQKWIEFSSRKLYIGDIDNVDQENVELVLLCGERR